MRISRPYLLIICLSLLPLLSFFLSPAFPHTSDGLAHTIRFAAYYKELSAGQFPVRWVQQFHYGYGTALFNFVAPFAYIITVPMVAAHLPLALILKISFALSHIAGGVFMYLFAQKLFGSKHIGFIVAILYQFAPFRLVEMNVRGNLGSLYAYAFAPLLFYAILRMKEKGNYSSFVLAAASVALLALSHTILGYAFIGLAALFCITTIHDIKKIVQIGASFLAGSCLAAFFILPAFLEQKYTNGYLFSKDVFYDHFPALHKLLIPNLLNSKELLMSEISVQIGLFHVISLFLLVYFLLSKRIQKKYEGVGWFVVAITVLIIVFMQPIALPLWERVSLLRQLQFPWRFVAIIIFTSTLSAGLFLTSIRHPLKKSTFIALIFLIIASTAYYWQPLQGYDKPDERLYWNYPLTTNYFSEVNSIWMGEEPTRPPTKKIEVVSDKAAVKNTRYTSTLHSYTVSVPRSSLVVDCTFYFPGWKAMVDGKYIDIQFQDPRYRGLITFEIPAGAHRIDVKFEQSKVQKLGNWISIGTGALFILYGLIIIMKKRTQTLH